jgi:hypothetical protein
MTTMSIVKHVIGVVLFFACTFGPTLYVLGSKVQETAEHLRPQVVTLDDLVSGKADAYLSGRHDAIRECALYGQLKMGPHEIPCLAPFPVNQQEM